MRELSLLKRARARELKEEGQMLDGVVADAASGTASRRLRLSKPQAVAAANMWSGMEPAGGLCSTQLQQRLQHTVPA